MSYSWAWGAEPDEWIEDDWRDDNGEYHDISELGGQRTPVSTEDFWDDDVPF